MALRGLYDPGFPRIPVPMMRIVSDLSMRPVRVAAFGAPSTSTADG